MIVYVIRLGDETWSFNKGWRKEAEVLPAIYPDLKTAEKALKGTPSKPSMPIWNAEFYGCDVNKIEIVPFTFEEVQNGNA